MSRILADIVGFGKGYMRSKTGAFFAFFFPILLILLFGAIFSSSTSKVSLPVQNLDDGQYSQQILDILNETGLVKIEMISPHENMTEYISNESLSLALYIPPGFSDNVSQRLLGEGTGQIALTLYGDPSQSTFGTVNAALDAAVTALNYNLAGTIPLISYEVRHPGSKQFSFLDFFVPGVVGITVMTNSLYSMTSICASYKSRGYFKLLATTMIQKYEWLVSKFIFYSLLLYVSLFVTFAVGKAAFGLEAQLTPLSLLLIPAGAFLFVSLGMLVGIVIKDPESGAAISNAIGFPMMFLSGSFWPIDSMPMYMQAIARAMPLTYFNDGLRDTMVYGNSAGSVLNLAIVIVIGLVFFVLASKLMSWKEQ
jgi:ABC-2 type transport system permease protein